MLDLYVTAQRRFRLEVDADEQLIPLPSATAARIERAFRDGQGPGLLYLATSELKADLPPTLAFGRSFARRYVTHLCHLGDAEVLKQEELVAPPGEAELSDLALEAPPMKGLEYLDSGVLRAAWRELDAHVRTEVVVSGKGLRAYLHEKNPLWRVVGRVTFHLAENKRDEEYPFAFLATYAGGVSERGEAQHLPLARALQEYSGASNRKRLVALLTPIRDASESLPWVQELVESADVYHPLAWTPVEAHRFLRDVPALEASGLIVRIPDWWKAERSPRPQVSVRVGGQPVASLGADALLDFSVALTLGGEALSEAEKRELLSATGGLVRLRGQWVEVDGEKLAAALAHWKRVEREALSGGISFYEGMRLLAGASEAGDAVEEAPQPLREWSGIEAGEGLRDVLARVRDPEREAELSSSGLRATLRPYQRAGAKWLALLTSLGLGACLADDMGLGKTIQVLALLLHLRAAHASESANAPDSPRRTRGTAKSRTQNSVLEPSSMPASSRLPSLIVAPASLIANWKAEIERFAPGLSAFVAHPSECAIDLNNERALAESLDGMALVITTYGVVTRTPALRQRRWHLVVLDEAQAIKNAGAQQSRAVKQLVGAGRIALTGTPVDNRLDRKSVV